MMTVFLISITGPLMKKMTGKKKTWEASSETLMLGMFFLVVFSFSPLPSPQMDSLGNSTDSMSKSLSILSFWISALSVVAMTHLKPLKTSSPFLFLITALNITLIWAFHTNSMIMFFILFETSLIPTILIIFMWGYQPERIMAGLYMLFYTLVGSLPLLVNLLLIHSLWFHSSFNYPIYFPTLNKFGSLTTVWWLLCISAFMVKMPLFIAHLWLPKAHVEAPVAGSMILAGLLLKLGSYGLIRMSSSFPSMNSGLIQYISTFALWGALLTSVICLRQTDMKALIAYASVGHMALIIAASMSNSSWGWNGSLMMMIAHGISSSGLFLMANCWYSISNSRSTIISKGFLTIFPSLIIPWFLLNASNMSAPPFINLLSEIMLVSAIVLSSKMLLPVLAMITLSTGAYTLFLYAQSSHSQTSGKPRPSSYPKELLQISALLHLSPAVLLILTPNILTWT
uniref:NADH-ubiquinone oxidoreductase chain 4 n=1 Tax=Brachiopoda sp. TaxID=3230945 RepID=A0AAU8HMY2_9BILA